MKPRIRPEKATAPEIGSAWARELYDLFATVRKEAATHTEKEIGTDLDRAVAAVRREGAQK
jgi:hypothetical protein